MYWKTALLSKCHTLLRINTMDQVQKEKILSEVYYNVHSVTVVSFLSQLIQFMSCHPI